MKNKKILYLILIIVLIIFVFLSIFKDKIEKIIYPKPYHEIVSNYSKKYEVDENLIYAVMKAESNFNEKAVSHKKAIGLMQIMEETAKDVVRKYDIGLEYNITKEEIADIENNINIGTKYLSVLLEKYKNKEVAVSAYNAGIGTVDKWIKNNIIKEDGSDIEKIPYKETNNYVRKILRDYKIYKELYK